MTRRGFSLLEVLVAVVFLAVGLSAIVGTCIQAQHAAAEASATTRATLLAHDLLAQVRSGERPARQDTGEAFGFPWRLSVEHAGPRLQRLTVEIGDPASPRCTRVGLIADRSLAPPERP